MWINALSDSGFEINTPTPLAMELRTFYAPSNGAVLLQGTLPNLSGIIARTFTRCPKTHIIVASEENSFTIRHKVMYLNEANYIAGPMSPAKFRKTIRGIISRESLAPV